MLSIILGLLFLILGVGLILLGFLLVSGKLFRFIFKLIEKHAVGFFSGFLFKSFMDGKKGNKTI